jgi:hypothetical protein
MDRIPRLRIFVVAALVAAISVVAALLWITANHQEKKTSIPNQFAIAASAYHAHDYEFAADIMRPIAEAGDVNAQVNLGLALFWIGVQKALSKDKESDAPNIDDGFKW